MNQAHQGEREGSASSERQNSSERERVRGLLMMLFYWLDIT